MFDEPLANNNLLCFLPMYSGPKCEIYKQTWWSNITFSLCRIWHYIVPIFWWSCSPSASKFPLTLFRSLVSYERLWNSKLTPSCTTGLYYQFFKEIPYTGLYYQFFKEIPYTLIHVYVCNKHTNHRMSIFRLLEVGCMKLFLKCIFEP